MTRYDPFQSYPVCDPVTFAPAALKQHSKMGTGPLGSPRLGTGRGLTSILRIGSGLSFFIIWLLSEPTLLTFLLQKKAAGTLQLACPYSSALPSTPNLLLPPMGTQRPSRQHIPIPANFPHPSRQLAIARCPHWPPGQSCSCHGTGSGLARMSSPSISSGPRAPYSHCGDPHLAAHLPSPHLLLWYRTRSVRDEGMGEPWYCASPWRGLQ